MSRLVRQLTDHYGVQLVGFDSGQAQIDAITNGVMAGAITQNPVGMGEEVVKAAVKAINKMRREQPAETAAPTPTEALLAEIRDELKARS